MEHTGNIIGAIKKLCEFLKLDSTTHHQKIARSQIERLSSV